MGGSLNCCCKVCMCVGGGVWGECVWVCLCGCVGVIVWVGVGVIAWVWKGVCGWYSLNCCCKVCMCVGGEYGGSVCGCDIVGVWV